VTNLRIILLLFALVVAIASWFLTCSAWRYDNVLAGVLPLEPREFERLTLVTLGTGGARENPDRRGPSSAVARGPDIALVDAGRALAESLRAARIPVAQPDWILLTNLLPENTVGLDDVLLTGWQGGRETPLRLIGPRGTRALARSLESAFARAVDAAAEARGLDASGAKFEVVEIEDGWSASLGALEVTAGALPGGPLEAFAYRFSVAERSLVVAGTGWADDALADFARGADVLVHEAVYVPTPELASTLELDVTPERLQRDAALHTGIDEVGRLANRASVSTLVLVRLYPPPVYDVQLTSVIGADFEGRIVIAEDGDEITP
jgi:ribonuclease BN (tRNA processing enzyme)